MECFCENPECKWSKEQRGGKFTFVEGKWYCEECAPLMKMPEYHGDSLFAMSSMHISDNPNQGAVRVNSLHHLRKLEAKHGVQSVAANMDQKNWGR